MGTRFSAADARRLTETAIDAQRDLRKQEQERKKLLAQKYAELNKKFQQQRSTILAAAADGLVELECSSVFLFQELIVQGIEVVEIGLVKPQKSLNSKTDEQDELEALENQVIDSFEKFVSGAKNDLKKYYGSVSLFREHNKDVIDEFLSLTWHDDEFVGDEIFVNEVPHHLRRKFAPIFEELNQKLDAYRDFAERVSSTIGEYESNELTQGIYIFGVNDLAQNVLKPSESGNLLRIRWQCDEVPLFLNEPLFSGVGLMWLSSRRGQELLEEIFTCLSEAAGAGKAKLKLNFSISKEGWYFKKSLSKFHSCRPDELVEIIELEGFIVEDTTSTEKNYAISVSW